jgi:hypothetical protein
MPQLRRGLRGNAVGEQKNEMCTVRVRTQNTCIVKLRPSLNPSFVFKGTKRR